MNNKEFRLGNIVQNMEGKMATVQLLDCEYDHDTPIRAWLIDKPALGTSSPKKVPLTKEIAEQLGFQIIDMGDHWEFNKSDFQLIQIKVPATGNVLPPFMLLHGNVTKRIKVEFVHKLQNLFYEIEGEELILRK